MLHPAVTACQSHFDGPVSCVSHFHVLQRQISSILSRHGGVSQASSLVGFIALPRNTVARILQRKVLYADVLYPLLSGSLHLQQLRRDRNGGNSLLQPLVLAWDIIKVALAAIQEILARCIQETAVILQIAERSTWPIHAVPGVHCLT